MSFNWHRKYFLQIFQSIEASVVLRDAFLRLKHIRLRFFFLIRRRALNEMISENNSDEDVRLPRIVHIETRSQCNGGCHFCAAAIQFGSRPDITMSVDLFNKIVTELKDLNFSGRLSLYSNNEPFLDRRIFEFVSYARSNLPNCFLELKSNGISVNWEKIVRIFDCGLDFLYINDYSFSYPLEHRKNVNNIKENLAKSRRFRGSFDGKVFHGSLKIVLRDGRAVLDSRAGTAPNKRPSKMKNNWICLRPVEMLTIDPRGTIGLCSEDVMFDASMGSVLNDSIYNIWNSIHYKKVRSALLRGDRSVKSTCANCDYEGCSREFLAELDL